MKTQRHETCNNKKKEVTNWSQDHIIIAQRFLLKIC